MNRKNKAAAVLLGFIPMLIVMAGIFLFSAMPGDESSETSGGLIKAFMRLFGHDSGDISDRLFRLLNLLVRKIAHFTEYGVLGACSLFCTAGFFEGERSTAAIKNRIAFFGAWLICILYAASDEVHQYFVAGRYGTFTDVLIDSAGAVTGILIFRAILKKRAGKNRRLNADTQNVLLGDGNEKI